MSWRSRPDDEGTVLVLTLGYCVLALLLVLGVVDVTAFYLARRDLQTVADGAALTAAQQLSASGAYGGGDPLTLDQGDVDTVYAHYAAGYDALHGPSAHVEWSGDGAGAVVDGDSVAVTLRRKVDAPLLAVTRRLGLDPSVTLQVHATARLCVDC